MNRNPVPGAYYLFVIPSFKDNAGINGYMPLKSGYGFITPTTSPEVVAHELGHVREALHMQGHSRRRCN